MKKWEHSSQFTLVIKAHKRLDYITYESHSFDATLSGGFEFSVVQFGTKRDEFNVFVDGPS